MTKTEKKQLAQDLILHQLSIIGYGDEYEKFVSEVGSQTEADTVLKAQMDRVAKMFGYNEAWFA